jgi:hypothetical protein
MDMARIRVFPVISVAVLALGLLLGGWVLYQDKGVIQPAEKELGSLPGVTAADIVLDRDKLDITLSLTRSADLSTIYPSVIKLTAPLEGGKERQILLKSHSNQDLDKAAEQSQLSIYEAIGTQKFTMIEDCLNDAKKAQLLTNYSVQLDQDYVYISLYQGKYYKFMVYPREHVTEGGKHA